jgi:hypothetical protein
MSTVAGSIPLSAPADSADRRRHIIAIIAASSGNLVEWYDFYAYAFTSAISKAADNRVAKNCSRPVGVAPATALRS